MRVLLLNGPAADGIAARVRCHGRDGGGDGTGAFPRLQNQTVEYLYEALKTYALGTRPSGIIQPVAVELDEAEMRVLAAHYAGQAAPGPAASLGPASADPESLALGRRIAEEGLPERGVAACAGCHGPEPRPTHPLYPRLSEHHAGYIAAQLELWMTGVRGNERGGQSVQRRHPGMAAARQLRRAQHPRVTSREPLWDEPDLAEQVKQGRHFLPGTITGRRETIVTSPVEARPQYVAIIPGPSWSHVVAAVGTAGFFLPLTAQFVWVAFVFGAVAVVAVVHWLRTGTDHGPIREGADIGGGLRLPVYVTGRDPVGWWATVVLLVDGTIFGCIAFTHGFLWLVNGDAAWPPPGTSLPDLAAPTVAAALVAVSAAAFWTADLLLRRGHTRLMPLAVLTALALLLLGLGADLRGLWEAGVRPTTDSFGAAVYANQFWQGLHAAVVLAMALYLAARAWAGMVDPARRVTFDNVRLFWFYTVVQALAGMALVHLFPRGLAGG